MRDTFIEELTILAESDRDVTLITGDLGFGVLDNFRKKFPKQYLNAGVAEQNMTTVAAGMAIEGKKVFTYSIVATDLKEKPHKFVGGFTLFR